MKKIFALMMCAAVSSAMAVKASRVGPVSTYGELKAKNGQLVGSCPQYSNEAVQVKGMSLFWSSGNTNSTDFYSEKGINRLVDDMKIEVVRFALGAAEEKFDAHGRAYTKGGEDFQKALLKSVVNAAVDRDIYIIIDWHIESSDGFTDDAVKFFEYAAKEYGEYNNVIFEIWNEPTGSMDAVKQHADRVIPVIRKYSDNLILVGSPGWSSQPDACANAGISDNNYGCTLHFYAASHFMGNGGYDKAAEAAMNKGVPVFATEWGTVNANGDGGPNMNSSQSWVDWMSQKKVSWTNWNASAMDETSAAFRNASLDGKLSYTESGEAVKGFIAPNPTYKDCGLQNGKAEEESGFSNGVAAGTTTAFIDDVEDGDRYSYIGGWWNAFEDNGDGGGSIITNPKIVDDFGKETYDVVLPSDGGKNTSKYMVGLKGVELHKKNLSYGPYVALGLNLKKDTTVYADFANCKTIKYKYKGASHNFRIETTDVTDYNYHRVNKDNASDWKEVEITVDMLKQETWGNASAPQMKINLAHANRLAWEIKGLDAPDDANKLTYNYLYVDDLSCDGLAIKAVVGGGNDNPTSSSAISNPSSSSVAGASSSSTIAPVSSSSVLAPASSSSAVVPASSATVVGKTVVDIDDVEDVDEVLKTTGTWYAYTDKEPGGKSSILNVYDNKLGGFVVSFAGSEDPTNGTKGFVGLKGMTWDQGAYTEAPFVALGLNTNADTSKGIDLSACSAISYRYKGSAHTFKVQDGSVTDYAYHAHASGNALTWTTVTIPLEDILQPNWTMDPKDLDWANIKKMAWEVIGYKGFEAQPEIDYLYVDDLKCVELPKAGLNPMTVAARGIKLGFSGKMLNVNFEKAGSARIQVFDMMGHVVESRMEHVSAGASQFSLEGLSNGNYVVRVMMNGAAKTARVSIK